MSPIVRTVARSVCASTLVLVAACGKCDWEWTRLVDCPEPGPEPSCPASSAGTFSNRDLAGTWVGAQTDPWGTQVMGFRIAVSPSNGCKPVIVDANGATMPQGYVSEMTSNGHVEIEWAYGELGAQCGIGITYYSGTMDSAKAKLSGTFLDEWISRAPLCNLSETPGNWVASRQQASSLASVASSE